MTGGIRVLHVDDDPNFLDLTSTVLARQDDRLEVVTESVAASGLERLTDGGASFDCVVSDYQMPEMNGLELLEAVREQAPDLPFILFTGEGSESIASDAITRGATDYLRKGTQLEQYELLANRITNAVERYRSAQRAAELERIRRVRSEINRAVVHADTRTEIERQTCQLISEADPYRFAWIGRHDADANAVDPVAAAGVDQGYLDAIEITTDSGLEESGPTAKAVLTRELSVVQNIPEDATYEPWRAHALDRGYRSSAAIPLVYDDGLHGVLNVYADRTNAFDAQERDLLSELGADVAHALHRVDADAHRERYERLVDASSAGIFRATPDPNGRIVEANATLATLLGADTPERVTGHAVEDFVRGAADLAELRRRLDRDGVVQNYDVPIRTLTGEHRWGSLTLLKTEEPDGTYVDGIVRDVTERKERDRSLRLFREAIEASGHSVYFTKRDGTIVYVNPAFEQTTGYDADQVLGQNPRILKSNEHDREFYEELWGTILDGDVWRSEIVNKTKSGDRYVVDQTIAPVESEDGDIERFVAVNADISKQKERQQELERSRERLRALFEESPDAITVHDVEGNVVDVNRQNVENLGHSRETLLSMNVAEIEADHSADELRTVWDDAAIGERIKLQGRHRRRDGTTFPVEVWITKIRFHGNERFIAFSRDVSERHEYEQELERQIDRLEQFATVVSHDLRNPLNVAEGRIDLVQSERASDRLNAEAGAEHLDVAAEALKRMEELIEDLLVLAREGGRANATDAVALGNLMDECWRTVSTAEASLVIDTDRTIIADPARLRQLFENLLRNAIEHAGEDVTITIGDVDGGFYVADDGPGIPAEEREDVFATGYSTADDGTGLGLNIVDQIAEAHGWTVTVTESETGGARFEITGVEVQE
ncbi:PAS domain S-box protein [Halobellus sp. Atlit-38R]|uniref:PAS domain S-box protein n=1 Tax=Halobellus sp. Atlit-38R TaxID=2282131 RepID=UPI001314A396|nr:PAS domain S-box protein [Halobellus sp. Atlit-38R]